MDDKHKWDSVAGRDFGEFAPGRLPLQPSVMRGGLGSRGVRGPPSPQEERYERLDEAVALRQSLVEQIGAELRDPAHRLSTLCGREFARPVAWRRKLEAVVGLDPHEDEIEVARGE